MTTYTTPRWRRRRAQLLRDQPECACGEPATIADHVIPRTQLIDHGIEDPDDLAYLQALCKRCHDRKTATIDGGFGRPATPIHDR